MKTKIFLLLFFQVTLSHGAIWQIDSAHSEAGFKIRHMTVVDVSGTIQGFKGNFAITEAKSDKVEKNSKEKKNEEITAVGTLDMKTLSTNNAQRDKHLHSADFFDVQKFPTATFKSKKVLKGKGEELTMVGDFTMKGITKELTLVGTLTEPIKDPMGKNRRGFSAKTQLNRKDYDVIWNKKMDSGEWVLGETVDINISLALTQG